MPNKYNIPKKLEKEIKVSHIAQLGAARNNITKLGVSIDWKVEEEKKRKLFLKLWSPITDNVKG